MPAPLPRTRTLLTTRRHWRKRVSVRRRASGRAHYNYFRDYDPAVGRYVESDPLGLNGNSFSLPEELNTYAYAMNDPLSLQDPLGLAAEDVAKKAGRVHPAARIGIFAMAACRKIPRCRAAIERAGQFCKNLECKFERHTAHHNFPMLGWCEHYSLTCWEKGVGIVFRSQWPFPGRCVGKRPSGPLPDRLPGGGE